MATDHNSALPSSLVEEAGEKPKHSIRIPSKSGLDNTVGYLKDLFMAGPDGPVGKGLELGVGAVLAKTILKRLPAPFNFLAPFVAEKVIMKHGVDGGRDVLLKGLKWIKKVTEEKEETPEY
jgi:hypothetical protein